MKTNVKDDRKLCHHREHVSFGLVSSVEPRSVRDVASVRMLGEVRHFGLEVLPASEGGDPGPGLLGDDHEVKARPPLQLPAWEALPGHSTGAMGQWMAVGTRRDPREEQGGQMSCPGPRWDTGGGRGVERVRLVASGFARAAVQSAHPRGPQRQAFVFSILRPEAQDRGTGGGVGGPPEGPGERVRPRPPCTACGQPSPPRVFACCPARPGSGPRSPLCQDVVLGEGPP